MFDKEEEEEEEEEEDRTASYPMRTRGSSLGVERPGREADRSPPFSADAKMRAAITPLPNTPSWRGIQLK
jgi:hypothetical protein